MKQEKYTKYVKLLVFEICRLKRNVRYIALTTRH
jgi:hypothetical protein